MNALSPAKPACNTRGAQSCRCGHMWAYISSVDSSGLLRSANTSLSRANMTFEEISSRSATQRSFSAQQCQCWLGAHCVQSLGVSRDRHANGRDQRQCADKRTLPEAWPRNKIPWGSGAGRPRGLGGGSSTRPPPGERNPRSDPPARKGTMGANSFERARSLIAPECFPKDAWRSWCTGRWATHSRCCIPRVIGELGGRVFFLERA